MKKQNNAHFFEIKPGSKIGINFFEIIEYWELIYFFSWRDIKVKYKQTLLGFLWAVLQPFIMMIILTLVAKKAFDLSSSEIPYPIFTFSGFLVWNIFATGTNNAGNSLIQNAEVIKKIYFPRIIIPTSSIVVSFFDFLMGLIAFLLLLIFFKQPVNLLLLIVCWPASLLVTFITTVGLGCFLAALNAKYRDFRHVTPFLIQVLFFLTPVFFPISFLKNTLIKYIVVLNPMYAALDLFRAPLVSTPLNGQLLFISIFSGIFLFWIGLYYFKNTEKYFADFI